MIETEVGFEEAMLSCKTGPTEQESRGYLRMVFLSKMCSAQMPSLAWLLRTAVLPHLDANLAIALA